MTNVSKLISLCSKDEITTASLQSTNIIVIHSPKDYEAWRYRNGEGGRNSLLSDCASQNILFFAETSESQKDAERPSQGYVYSNRGCLLGSQHHQPNKHLERYVNLSGSLAEEFYEFLKIHTDEIGENGNCVYMTDLGLASGISPSRCTTGCI